MHGLVEKQQTSHPDKAETEHARFPTHEACIHQAPSFVMGESHEGTAICPSFSTPLTACFELTDDVLEMVASI